MGSRPGDYEHVVRIVAVFLLGTAAFLIWRAWMVPDDFGVYGHYRAGALVDARDQPLEYAGEGACIDCHGDAQEVRVAGRHASVRCEACHGPLNAHATGEVEGPPPRPDPRATCLTCHTAGSGKPPAFPQIVVEEHAPEGACTLCHTPHRPGLS